MDRFALFVDAGYLYGAGGKLCHNTKYRANLLLDFGAVSSFLTELCSRDSGLPPLRTYWYDGATDRTPTPSHIALSHQSGVKLRLGRLTKSGQKGVDSRIVRDLIVLSHNRSMASAYLLGGDEDLREGVEAAQEWGIPVTLIGIDPSREGGQNLSPTLVRAVDELIVLGEDQVSGFLSRREEGEGTTQEEATKFGRVFGARWLEKADEADIDAVREIRPRIRGDVDARLMESAEEELGTVIRGNQELRHSIRGGFWDSVAP